MGKVTGQAAVDRYFASIPVDMTKVLRGAGKAGGAVIRDEAKGRSISADVSAGVVMRTKVEPERIVVTITLKPGWPLSVGVWLEYGTAPHFITVDDSQRDGRSARRINELAREGSLVIGGKFVGTTVYHPGAQPHPFLRPALDVKQAEAIAAAQSYINSHVSRAGITVPTETVGDDE